MMHRFIDTGEVGENTGRVESSSVKVSDLALIPSQASMGDLFRVE